MSLRLGDTIISGVSRHTKSNSNPLLSFRWFDHIVNSMEWLRADTFSWQSGDVYTSVYNLLVAEYQNGTEEIEGSITFKRSPNGYKITTDESGVSALFNNTGVAWYYIIDTENRRFKLPRSKYNAYAKQVAVRGNDMTLGVTNGTDNGGLIIDTNGAIFERNSNYGQSTGNPTGTGVIGTEKSIGITTDPTKSGIVADLPTQELHLYFYVGQYSQTATEQTAGITTEVLNSKADIDLSNILSNIDYVVESKTPTESDPSWYRVYKSGWVEQGGHITTEVANVIFMKVMANAFYNVSLAGTGNGNSGSAWADGTINCYNKTTTGMSIHSMRNVTQGDWQVSGQGA